MKTILVYILFFFILSCEKNYDPVGDGEVYLETSQEVYALTDSVKLYLINNSNRSLYSHPPGDWALSKKIGEEWIVIYPEVIAAVVLPPHEWKNQHMLVFTHTFPDTGLFKIQMYFSWDKEAKYLDKLGWVFSNIFQITSGT